MFDNRKIRLLIADNHRLVSEACKQLLEPEFDVVDIVTDGRELVRAAMNLKPDGIILEIVLSRLSGLEAAGQLRHKLTTLKLVFLTSNSDVNAAAEAFRHGASGYVLKHSGAEEFVTAIRLVMRGESYLSPLIARETIEYILRPPKHATLGQQLTRREAEILQLLTEGMSMKQVAHILDIAPNTVAFHKYKMMDKLRINSNAGLIQYAIRKYMAPASENWTITDSTGTKATELIEGSRSFVYPTGSNHDRLRDFRAAQGS